MSRVIILSDTHGYLDKKIFPYLQGCDEIWHAGDIGSIEVALRLRKAKPLRAVYGNIDGIEIRNEFPEDLVFIFEGIKVFMTHIGGYPGKYTARTKKIIREEKPHLFICGHSHILKVMYDKEFDLLHINPGAAGREGLHQKKTMVRLTMENGEMIHLEVIELGSRTT